MKLTSFSLVIILVLGMITVIDLGFEVAPKVKGAIIYVDDDGGANYTTIYEAVWAANPGDTIYVYNGTYSGASLIDVSLTLIGEDRNNTIMDGKDAMFSDAVFIDHDHVNISGFTIINWTGGGYGGIYIDRVSHINITGNNFIANNFGVDGLGSSENVIANNLMMGNTYDGINFEGISSTNDNLGNYIYENQISNSECGISFINNQNNHIYNNTITNNKFGIYLDDSGGNEINRNNISLNSDHGLFFRHLCDNNNITENIISKNGYGFYFNDDCDYNNIFVNYIINNGMGAYSNAMGMIDNVFYHNNFINNIIQAEGYANWDNGYPSGGNFWSNYNGSDFFRGPNQNIPGSDGIGDTKHDLPSQWLPDEDNYPLMSPWGDNLYLSQGWNLVSIPNLQSDSDPEIILNSIKDNFSALQYYDASDSADPWKHNHLAKPSKLNDLDEINHSIGLWIEVTEPNGVYFECPGTPPETNQSIPLYKGWNMVGYPSFSKYNRNEALNNLNFGNQVDAIWTYNARAQKWEEVGESDYFIKGRGYWIQAKTDCVWEVPL